jgi:hypothetical protein
MAGITNIFPVNNTPNIFRGGEVPLDKLIYGKRYRVQSRYSPGHLKHEGAFVGRLKKPSYHDFSNIIGDIIRVQVEGASFSDYTVPVESEDLMPGREYQIVSSSGNFAGTLLEPDYYYFDNVIDEPGGYYMRSTGERRNASFEVPADICNHRFYEEGMPRTYNQAYRGLAENLPENTVGIIKGLVEGPNAGRGPHVFPARPGTGKNNTTTRNSKRPRPRTRKNKKGRKSKKSMRRN